MTIRGCHCKEVVAPKSKFDKRSFRWKKSGRGLILIGCPKGKWNARTQRCKVGTRAHEVLHRAKKRCPAGERRICK